MPHSFGYRARTRQMFSKPHRRHGAQTPSKNLEVYHQGELVDVVADGAVQKGMPYKCYHGKTGRVFTVTRHGIGVELNKRVRYRLITKRIYVRHEHVRKSRSREDFLKRMKVDNDRKAAAKKEGKIISTKRVTPGPRGEQVIKEDNVEYINPLRFKDVF